jgi:lipoprotein NlpD
MTKGLGMFAAALLGGGLLSGCIPPSVGGGAPAYSAPAPEEAASQDGAWRPAPQRPAPQRPERRPPPQRAERLPAPQTEVRTLPAPPPAWEVRKVTPDAKRVSAATSVVQPGESLRGISAKTGAGSEAIARANGIPAPFTIRAGQRLTIPGGRYHLVRTGESGIAIARAYGVDWSKVVTANAMQEPYILRTGQRLLIPDVGPETLEQRAARFHIDIDDILTGGEPALAEKAKPAKPTPSSARVLPPTVAVVEPTTRTPGLFAWPVKGALVKRFGPGKSGERNDGIKIAVPLDTPILASADGVVAYVGSDVPALGGLVIVKHGQGWTSVYGHAGQLLVQRGQSVKRGQMIALSGKSGFADRPEVHFELRHGRTPVDPVARLPKR